MPNACLSRAGHEPNGEAPAKSYGVGSKKLLEGYFSLFDFFT